MDLTQYKIDNYTNGVSLLPDYPSDEGYTAEQLKAVFDSRSDKEIKNQHNALVDALGAVLAEFAAHTQRTDNPHGVTSEQIGTKSVIEAIQNEFINYVQYWEFEEAIASLQAQVVNVADDIQRHISSGDNPHSVTAEQIGVYTKEEINAMIGQIDSGLDAAIAAANEYIEGANISDAESVVSVDLSAYATKEYVDSAIRESVLDSWEAEI